MRASFSSSYLAGDVSARAFLPFDVADPPTRIRRARELAGRSISPTLLATLRAQSEALPPSPARRAQLDALATPGTTVIVTGQQVGLFLGPLYTFYKAASAIATARAVERESGVRCVPLFWLQTEDHDFPEINHCYVPQSDGEPLKLELPADAPQSEAWRVSVKYRLLDERVRELLGTLEDTLGALPHATEFLTLLKEHYRPGQSLAAAFAGVLAAAFADEGLLVFDPREAAVARLSVPLYRKAIDQASAIATRLRERSEALHAAGFEEQVHVRGGSPLVFFHEGSAAGPRHRLERSDDDLRGGWSLVGTRKTVSDDEVARLLVEDPLRFSTSALFRPVVEDTLLPTAFYVGGPGELNYFAQLAPLYDFFDLPPPVMILRARFRCLEDHTCSLLDKLRLSPADAGRPREELVQAAAGWSQTDQVLPEQLKGELLGALLARLDALQGSAAALDPNLLGPIRRTRETVSRAIGKLTRRYGRSLLEKDRVTLDRIDRLKRLLHPREIPQERFYSLAYFACKHGLQSFKQTVFSRLAPFVTAIEDLHL